MIKFPNAKINLGLYITSKREDGYHNIETLFYPIALKDALEIVPAAHQGAILNVSGNKIDCEPQKNLVVKAYELLRKEFSLPGVDIYLHKIIPDGAGLGGGSADATETLKILNEMFCLNLSDDELARYASCLGADCSFFVYNRPMMATGIGNVFSPIDIDLSGKFLLLIKPEIYVSTKAAYSQVVPKMPAESIDDIVSLPITAWQGKLINDFEQSVFAQFTKLITIKESLIASGALYSSMSGSGSSMYGIYDSANMAENAKKQFTNYLTYITELK